MVGTLLSWLLLLAVKTSSLMGALGQTRQEGILWLYADQVYVQRVPGHASIGSLQDTDAWAAHWNDVDLARPFSRA